MRIFSFLFPRYLLSGSQQQAFHPVAEHGQSKPSPASGAPSPIQSPLTLWSTFHPSVISKWRLSKYLILEWSFIVSKLVPFCCGREAGRSMLAFCSFLPVNDYKGKHWSDWDSLRTPEVDPISGQRMGASAEQPSRCGHEPARVGPTLGQPAHCHAALKCLLWNTSFPIPRNSSSHPHFQTPAPARFPLPSHSWASLVHPPATFWLWEHLNSDPAQIRMETRMGL